MTQYSYVIRGMSKYIEGKQILKETWLSFLPNAKIGIIGANGAGKSTLMKIMAGIDKNYEGEAWAAKGVTVGYLPQEPQLPQDSSVIEEIYNAVKDKKNLLTEFENISNKFLQELTPKEMDELIEEQGALQERIDALNIWDLDNDLEIAMSALGCPNKNAKIGTLSGGEKRRIALCKLLLEQPNLLLLDEPTNHLDSDSITWLEHYLKNYKGTVIIITHDRYFLDNITEWVLEIERGKCVPWNGNYSQWLQKKHAEVSQEKKDDQSVLKDLKKELDWIRNAKNVSKARLKSYEELNQGAQTKEKISSAEIIIPHGPRLGDLVIELNNLSKSINGKVLINDFSCKIPPGSVVGIIGPNGVGKSTLFNMITNKIKPDSGIIQIGPTVKLGYVDQMRDNLDDTKTIWEEISDGLEEIELGNKIIKSRAYCSAFNFKGTQQQLKIQHLSGGQRNRVHMAKLLKEGANVILLDEPSNDLDMNTLRALEDSIHNFAGTILVITHDRWFLDRVATHIIAFDEPGTPRWFEGNYAEYYEYATKTLGYDFTNPKQKYKKFSKL